MWNKFHCHFVIRHENKFFLRTLFSMYSRYKPDFVIENNYVLMMTQSQNASGLLILTGKTMIEARQKMKFSHVSWRLFLWDKQINCITAEVKQRFFWLEVLNIIIDCLLSISKDFYCNNEVYIATLSKSVFLGNYCRSDQLFRILFLWGLGRISQYERGVLIPFCEQTFRWWILLYRLVFM